MVHVDFFVDFFSSPLVLFFSPSRLLILQHNRTSQSVKPSCVQTVFFSLTFLLCAHRLRTIFSSFFVAPFSISSSQKCSEQAVALTYDFLAVTILTSLCPQTSKRIIIANTFPFPLALSISILRRYISQGEQFLHYAMSLVCPLRNNSSGPFLLLV